GLSASAYATLGGSSRPGETTSATSSTSGSKHEKELAKTLADHFDLTIGGGPADGNFEHPGPVRVPDSSAEGLASLLKTLDPDGTHLRPFDRDEKAVGPADNWMVNSIWASSYWTPDGSTSLLRSENPEAKSKAFGAVGVYIWSPGSLGVADSKPCDIWANGIGAEMNITWSECAKHQLGDGSYVVTSHSTNLKARIILASRVFPDGGRVTVSVADTLVYDHAVNDHTTVLRAPTGPGFIWGESVDPMPWTESAIADALAAPAVKELPTPTRPAHAPAPGSGNEPHPGTLPTLTVRHS
ncbi:MAG: hypothetical protein HOV83_08765, partial [Catenulispora sp.]|nr:hypothetical protein [Catenulispora sp.]